MEADAERCFTTVSWLISQAEILNPPDNPASKRFTEKDLDAVISVLKDLFGVDPVPLEEDPEQFHPWKMRRFGAEAYCAETDLQQPLDPLHSPFQPHYDTLEKILTDNEARGSESSPYLGTIQLLCLFIQHSTCISSRRILEKFFFKFRESVSREVFFLEKKS